MLGWLCAEHETRPSCRHGKYFASLPMVEGYSQVFLIAVDSVTRRERTRIMDLILPQTFSELVEEIAKFAGLSREEVERKLWLEALQPGWNVAQDVKKFDVLPHKYDNRMER